MTKKLEGKKIALLGTSPIMILLYFRLYKKNSVYVYEQSKVGGAWALHKYNGEYYPAHNNIIVPLKSDQEKYIDLINRELKKLGCNKFKIKGKFKLLSNYNPKKKFIHDISNLYLEFKKNCKPLKKKVNYIKNNLNEVYINNKTRYDYIFIPSCFDIKKISIDNIDYMIKPNKSFSKHVNLIYNNIKLPNISYVENFDNVFDRGYFRKYKKFTIFVGRVRREYKKFNVRQLINTSYLLKGTGKGIVKSKLNTYCHNIINENKLKSLKLKLKKTRINLIDTKQFVRSYQLLNFR